MKIEKKQNLKKQMTNSLISVKIFNKYIIISDAIRSYVDKKKYHKYKLDSGLEVLIIRGKKIKKKINK